MVEKDEKEKGERRILNFGHTLGHALEKTSGLSHGEAVSVGMVFAAELSVIRKGFPKAAAERIRGLLGQIGLPTEISVDKEKILDALKRDKKREGGGVHFILLDSIGHAISEEIPLQELGMVIHDLC